MLSFSIECVTFHFLKAPTLIAAVRHPPRVQLVIGILKNLRVNL